MTRTAHLADERAQMAADADSAAREAAEADRLAREAAADAAYAAFEALTPEAQRRAVDESYGLYDTIYDY